MGLVCPLIVQWRGVGQVGAVGCLQVEQIESLPRPITMEDGGPVLMDLLWSDPTANDAVQGVQPSPRGPGLVTFGPDRVREFCKVWTGLTQAQAQASLARPQLPQETALSSHSHN